MLYLALCSLSAAVVMGSALPDEQTLVTVDVKDAYAFEHITAVVRETGANQKAIVYGLKPWQNAFNRGFLDEITVENGRHYGRYHQETTASGSHTVDYEDIDDKYMKRDRPYKPAVTVTATDTTQLTMVASDLVDYAADTLETAISLKIPMKENDQLVVKYHLGKKIEYRGHRLSTEPLEVSVSGTVVKRAYQWGHGRDTLILQIENREGECKVVGGFLDVMVYSCDAIHLRISGVQYVTEIIRRRTTEVTEQSGTQDVSSHTVGGQEQPIVEDSLEVGKASEVVEDVPLDEQDKDDDDKETLGEDQQDRKSTTGIETGHTEDAKYSEWLAEFAGNLEEDEDSKPGDATDSVVTSQAVKGTDRETSIFIEEPNVDESQVSVGLATSDEEENASNKATTGQEVQPDEQHDSPKQEQFRKEDSEFVKDTSTEAKDQETSVKEKIETRATTTGTGIVDDIEKGDDKGLQGDATTELAQEKVPQQFTIVGATSEGDKESEVRVTEGGAVMGDKPDTLTQDSSLKRTSGVTEQLDRVASETPGNEESATVGVSDAHTLGGQHSTAKDAKHEQIESVTPANVMAVQNSESKDETVTEQAREGKPLVPIQETVPLRSSSTKVGSEQEVNIGSKISNDEQDTAQTDSIFLEESSPQSGLQATSKEEPQPNAEPEAPNQEQGNGEDDSGVSMHSITIALILANLCIVFW